jgi:hypothetical protein
MQVDFKRVLTSVGLAMLAAVSGAETSGKTGMVCIAPLPRDVREADRLAFSGGPRRHFKYAFSVQIDQQAPVAVATSRPIALTGIALDRTHRVLIRDDHRVIESFRFVFAARGGTPLCLSYGPGYQTWSLARPRPRATWCQCE